MQLYKVWRDFYIVCITSMDLYHNMKHVEKVCPTWLLKPKQSDQSTSVPLTSKKISPLGICKGIWTLRWCPRLFSGPVCLWIIESFTNML